MTPLRSKNQGVSIEKRLSMTKARKAQLESENAELARLTLENKNRRRVLAQKKRGKAIGMISEKAQRQRLDLFERREERSRSFVKKKNIFLPLTKEKCEEVREFTSERIQHHNISEQKGITSDKDKHACLDKEHYERFVVKREPQRSSAEGKHEQSLERERNKLQHHKYISSKIQRLPVKAKIEFTPTPTSTPNLTPRTAESSSATTIVSSCSGSSKGVLREKLSRNMSKAGAYDDSPVHKANVDVLRDVGGQEHNQLDINVNVRLDQGSSQHTTEHRDGDLSGSSVNIDEVRAVRAKRHPLDDQLNVGDGDVNVHAIQQETSGRVSGTDTLMTSLPGQVGALSQNVNIETKIELLENVIGTLSKALLEELKEKDEDEGEDYPPFLPSSADEKFHQDYSHRDKSSATLQIVVPKNVTKSLSHEQNRMLSKPMMEFLNQFLFHRNRSVETVGVPIMQKTCGSISSGNNNDDDAIWVYTQSDVAVESAIAESRALIEECFRQRNSIESLFLGTTNTGRLTTGMLEVNRQLPTKTKRV
eukprot:CFRG0258T1